MATVMALVEDGLLSLDDKVSKFYPEWFTTAPVSDMKLIDMMAHMSGYGLADDWVFDDDITL
jgi:CubicO group peptidase (beta-lactamase class C family)